MNRRKQWLGLTTIKGSKMTFTHKHYFQIFLLGDCLWNVNLVLYANSPLMAILWRTAVICSLEQSQSRHHTAKHCYTGCPLCSHKWLRNGCTITRANSDGVPVTMVVSPLKQKCSRMRRVSFVVHSNPDSPNLISTLLILAGDVETNPGPTGMYLLCGGLGRSVLMSNLSSTI